MTRNGLVLVALVCLLQTTAKIADKEKGPAPRVTLTADERQLLDGLFKQGLIDPTGAERVRVKTSVRTSYGVTRETVREAWFRKSTDKTAGTLLFVDGEERSVSDRRGIATVDFVAKCRDRFPRVVPAPPKRKQPDADPNLRRASKPVEEIDKSPLFSAAWLYRLGHEDLAVRAFSQGMSEARATFGAAAQLEGGRIDVEWLTRACRSELARVAFEEMVHAFMVAADDEALAAGERLVRLYPDESKQFRQTTAILNDLRRRKTAGTFGRNRTQQWPAAFKTWDSRKQTSYLIDSLDQIDGRPFSIGGLANLPEDASVKALARMGDPAVPRSLPSSRRIHGSRVRSCTGRAFRLNELWSPCVRQRSMPSCRLPVHLSLIRTPSMTACRDRATRRFGRWLHESKPIGIVTADCRSTNE
ncbi:MAG TPA: hypothetical protein VGP63_11100 [Planctomycetaceae bacterium]|jgi:hypothetical protein|nr:hypothetical protein [Planctomycetaceae bacterium]